eukprot:289412_1
MANHFPFRTSPPPEAYVPPGAGEDMDMMDLNTYGFIEWCIFVVAELIFGLLCIFVGVCGYHRLIKKHVYWAEDIEDMEYDKKKTDAGTPPPLKSGKSFVARRMSGLFRKQTRFQAFTVAYEPNNAGMNPRLNSMPMTSLSVSTKREIGSMMDEIRNPVYPDHQGAPPPVTGSMVEPEQQHMDALLEEEDEQEYLEYGDYEEYGEYEDYE